jgi:hypothetical protein
MLNNALMIHNNKGKHSGIIVVFVFFLMLFFFYYISERSLNSVTKTSQEENTVSNQENRNEEIEASNQECINNVKELMPKIFTFSSGTILSYSPSDNPDNFMLINGCDLRSGNLPGENINEYYGGCEFSFRSDDLYSEDGTVLGYISFHGKINSFKYLPDNDRYRDPENRYATNPLLKDFEVADVTFFSCKWIEGLTLNDSIRTRKMIF